MTSIEGVRSTAAADDLANSIVEAAVAIVDEAGVQGLTNRRLAERAGTSTMAIYTRFGSKDGVARAVFDRGFELLGASLQSPMRLGRPVDDLVTFCHRYRRFGLDRPGIYAIMFERVVSLGDGFASEPAARAFGSLAERVAAVSHAPLESDATRTTTFGLWALCHGLVNLELSGIGYPQQASVSEERFTRAVTTYAVGLAAKHPRAPRPSDDRSER